MFLEYYGLNEQPFGVTPDPRFLYLGNTHRETLASLICGAEGNRGFVALIAKAGTGKTSVLYQFLELLRDRASTVYLFRTDLRFSRAPASDNERSWRQQARDRLTRSSESDPTGRVAIRTTVRDGIRRGAEPK